MSRTSLDRVEESRRSTEEEAQTLGRYGTERGAAAYRRKYERSLFRRLSNRREVAIVDRALQEVSATWTVLDCPCGAGRLVPTILRYARHVTAVDGSGKMVVQARDALATEIAAGSVTLKEAPAEALPFTRDAFDVTLCHRLIYHVVDPDLRARIFAELARVTRRYVIVSFNDRTTLKMRWQAVRGRDRSRVAWTPDSLSGEVRPHGLTLRGPVRRLGSLFSSIAVATLEVAPRGPGM